MRKFWINTETMHKVTVTLVVSKIEDTIPAKARLVLKLKECTMFEYFMFDVFLINLKTRKEDKYKWLKFSIKTKVAHFIPAIVSKFSKTSPKTP